MPEFSRRVDIQIIKDEPKTFEEWQNSDGCYAVPEQAETQYADYLDRFQPYRWRAVAANNETIAHGESYFNEADCRNTAELLAGDDTTVYVMPMFGEDRGEQLLRYGVTDRQNQTGQVMTYRVAKQRAWTVTAPGGRTWSGAPSQPAAFGLATSLAAIDTMLANVRPVLTVVPAAPRAPEYGCYTMPCKARR